MGEKNPPLSTSNGAFDTAQSFLKEWPYAVNYGKEKEIETDVLIIGGGLAGCYAAISAAKKGMSVAVVEKGAVIRSGSAGSGIDHWLKGLYESLFRGDTGRNDGGPIQECQGRTR